MCCNVELTEIYKKCECRRCEDWGGCKHINGYYFSICPKCDKDFGFIKDDLLMNEIYIKYIKHLNILNQKDNLESWRKIKYEKRCYPYKKLIADLI